MKLAAGDVDFWEDIDVSYEGDAALTYRVELRQADGSVVEATCNALGHATQKGDRWTVTNVGDSHTRHGIGKMSCGAKLEKGGSTTVRATLAFTRKPKSATLTKGDLVVRQ